jgi:tryptophanyl-tRNA synthetase
LTDPEPVVRQKLKTMVTDPARIRRTDKGDPDKCPVGDLHKVFSTPETLAKVYDGCRSAGIGCIECKGWAADALVQVLQPIQDRRASYLEAQAIEILEDGSRRARPAPSRPCTRCASAMQMARGLAFFRAPQGPRMLPSQHPQIVWKKPRKKKQH